MNNLNIKKWFFVLFLCLGQLSCTSNKNDELHKKVLDTYVIKVSLLKGENILLTETKNPIIIYDGDKPTRYYKNKKARLNPKEYYIYCVVNPKPQKARKVYFIDLLIEDGPLKGSKIRIGDGKFQISNDCFQTLHKIPSKANLQEKDIKFQIVHIWQK